ncbi:MULTISPECIES: PIG-L family deacetylase [unclassified Devosia]|uniref:PIG-L family deacetylase n=1 Tax=unclassified Devosia TaxID=196773 RepID=UPI0015524AA8|nr:MULTISPECIES: PIG-L family deacetylase [unclassified Devosia]
MLDDRQRLHRRAASPRLVRLYRALSRLRSTVTVMNTGAHPDDEHNGMLALLRHQYGMRIVVACSTRGEGGQNTLGPERSGALGVLRSREMEEAARVIDADIAWLGHGPDDAVHDFGFSKSGPDTLARWGEDLIIERLVRAYRQYRPDIVIPTFLDVGGQHGHHRAMTQAAKRALALAADPTYRTDELAPWRVAKFYLPAWSGGGGTYDDEVPPPAATTWIEAQGVDEASGMSFDRLGEASRAFHASQNMGHWQHPAQTQWGLHRVGGTAEDSILAGLPSHLADLGPSSQLAQADAAIEEALAQFPDGTAVVAALAQARQALGGATAHVAPEHTHRLQRKLREVDTAMALAAGLEISAALASDSVTPGGCVDLFIEAEPGTAEAIAITPVASSAFEPSERLHLSDDKAVLTLRARQGADIANAFLPQWSSLGGNGRIWLKAQAKVGGEEITFAIDTEEPVQIAPAHSLAIVPDALILPQGDQAPRTINAKAEKIAEITIAPVPGLTVATHGNSLTVTPAADLPRGRHTLPVLVDGLQAHSVAAFAYPHIGRARFVRPLNLDILALDLALPSTRVGYIGGGADRVGLWLERMGAQVNDLDADALAGDLSGLDTIVVGIFAFGTRPDLAAATNKLHDWVKSGGHLVTLYHRPSDGWNPQATPPLPLTIGSPSLRWRVTNPAAEVTLLAPNHPLFSGPNQITTADFAGWDKERGLYFASSWDEAYQPLLAMSDAGEAPLTGSLLSASIGAGRHTHTSLVLHHQLDRLVPGAFRVMANLLQAA